VRLRLALAILALLGLAACAGRERVILLPGVDGEPTGGIALLGHSAEDPRWWTTPYTEARLKGRDRADVTEAEPGEIEQELADLLAALPPRPESFLLYFELGTTELVAESEPTLRALLAEVASRPGVEVQVTGHTDTYGTHEMNDRLSLERAQEIRLVLIARGLDESVVWAVGRGEREPLIETGQGVRNQRNRRVEVIVR